jgi:hypothetical protein
VMIDNALNASQAIDGLINQCTEQFDQLLFQERAVDRAAAFEQQRLRTENTRQLRQGTSEVVASRACEDIGRTIFTKLCEIGVRHLLADDIDDVITADMVLAVMHPSKRIDGDRERSTLPVSRSVYGIPKCRTATESNDDIKPTARADHTRWRYGTRSTRTVTGPDLSKRATSPVTLPRMMMPGDGTRPLR